jgi:ketosteroid isomerase-like protein
MSERNLELVKKMYDAFGKGDITFILRHCTSDVVWETVGEANVAGHYGRREGHDGVIDFFTKLGEENEFRDWGVETVDVAGEDKVFGTGRSEIVNRKTGKSFKERWIQMFTLRDGKIATWTEWDNSAGHLQSRS